MFWITQSYFWPFTKVFFMISIQYLNYKLSCISFFFQFDLYGFELSLWPLALLLEFYWFYFCSSIKVDVFSNLVLVLLIFLFLLKFFLTLQFYFLKCPYFVFFVLFSPSFFWIYLLWPLHPSMFCFFKIRFHYFYLCYTFTSLKC